MRLPANFSEQQAMSDTVVTRIAPSPTGFLHIGTARTALFNWLYARAKGGKYLLRIEDTDRERSTDEAIASILEGLAWLGLDHDADPVFQHAKLARHATVARDLLSNGLAYECYTSQDELKEMREKAKAEGRFVGYDGRWRDRDPSEAPDGVEPVLRFKATQTGETIIRDQVQGDVSIANEQLDDMILLRSDGTPTYMLSVVVDDYDMGITHVIRGDDHLNNAARQMQLIAALGWPTPQYVHVPLIHGPDGAKFSKRHGALGLEKYREMGYLPEALRNYLLRLGWSHGDDEIISTEQAIEWFDLDAIGKSAARFDFDKLDNLNGHYIRQADNVRLANEIIERRDVATPPDLKTRLSKAIPSLKDRAKTLEQLVEAAAFVFETRPLQLEPKAAKLLDEDARKLMGRLADALQGVHDWTHDGLEEAVRKFAEGEGLKLGKIAQPLRAALTGKTISPGIFDVLEIFGKGETLDRLMDQQA
jgi:glutamyl-tRNA synthetase